MSATARPPAQELDDAPAPRTPWRRWALAVVLAIPASAAYGALVMLVGRALFLDDAATAVLRAKVDDVPPATLLWLIATATCLGGVVLMAREVLDVRAARREGRDPDLPTGSERSWAWPVIWSGSPVAAVLLGAGAGGIARLAQGPDSVLPPVLFTVTAGTAAMLLVALGWLLLVVRDTSDDGEPPALEGVEDHWVRQAAASCFWDVMALGGIGAFVAVVTGDRVEGSLLLAGMLFAAQGDFAVRLWLLRRREERA